MGATRRRLRVLVMALACLLAPVLALAVQPDEVLKDPRLEARARALSAGLRCFVCQNQSIDDSNAPLARDLRLLVRERLVAGDSDEQVREFVVARYGEFVLLNPRLSGRTLLLWLTPLLVLGIAGFVVWRTQLVRPARPGGPALDDAERARLAQILGDKDQVR